MTFIAPSNKLFGHMDRLRELRDTGATSAPINVEIDLSNRCSLGCQWCHFAYTHTRGPLAGKREKPADAVAGGDLMDFALVLSILTQLEAAGVRSVTWTGGGEPTLHPDFDDVIGHASGFHFSQGIYTHGGHIDEARAALLKRAMTFVYVSLDAASAEAYKRDKGVDRFGAACDGIRRLVAADGDATVGVGFLVTRDNWEDIPAMADLGDELGADYVQFRPTILFDQKTPGIPAENTAWVSHAIRKVQQARYYRPNIEADVDRFRRYQMWQGHGYDTCFWSALQTAITPNGKVWACVNKREHAAAEIGDLTVESFADLWGRHQAQPVTDDCRVSCRGDVANLALQPIMDKLPHPEFV